MPTIHGPQSALLRGLGRIKPELGAIPEQASPAQLKTLLANNWSTVTRGRAPMVAKSEAAWLVKLAAHPSADASLKADIASRLSGMRISEGAMAIGFGDFMQSLTQTTPGGSTGGDLGIHTPGGPSVGGNVGNIPTGPTGPGNVLGVLTGNVGGAKKAGLNPLRHDKDNTFDGPWRLTADVLSDRYNDVDHGDFGTTAVELPGGGTYVSNDMVYDLENGEVGMHLIPVADNGESIALGDKTVEGHALMDAHLRKEMGLKDDDPIFALIAYVHPEEHSGDLKALAKDMVKTEMGATHMGAYVGKGVTSNSPESYHNRQWEVGGYPANVQVISLDGVPQAELNKNALYVDAALNEGVKFPPDYKNDKFRTIDLNTTLMFYRDWMLGADYLRTDPSWKTYCAEHKTIMANVMLNVPHNLDSFKEVFGEQDGQAMWDTFTANFESKNGRQFTAADETHFEPLWKKEGLSAEDIRPFDKADYDAYDKARHDGALDSFTGPRPLAPGKGMAWAPETTADLVNDFLETYVPVREVGGPLAATALMGFKDVVQGRMGLSDADFFQTAVPVMNKMMIADAMMHAEDPGYAKKAAAHLYLGFGGNMADLAPGGQPDAAKMGLVEQCLQGVKDKLGDILMSDRGDAAARKQAADAWLQKAIQPDLARARKLAVSDPGKTQFYSPPAVSHRVAIGLHESSPFVNVRTVATAVDASEVDTSAVTAAEAGLD